MNFDFLEYIPSNLMILVVVIYVIGIFLKQMNSVKDNYITAILMAFGIVFSILLNIINSNYSTMLEVFVNGTLQGILCWGTSVGINQLKVQANKPE